MWIVTLLVFVFILGIIVLFHELGHFLWAKKFGVYIYEFSIGMGPVIYSHKGKDGIDYNIRAFPIGGFVSMAGEVYDDDKKIPKEKLLCHKPIWQRIIVMAAGVVNNFIMALVLLIVFAFVYKSTVLTPQVLKLDSDYPVSQTNIQKGDTILAINNHKVHTLDEVAILLQYKAKDDKYTIKVKHSSGKEEEIITEAKTIEDESGNKIKRLGIYFDEVETHGFVNKIKFAFQKFCSILSQMWLTLGGLFTGKISVGSLSGPVGIYSVVGEVVKESGALKYFIINVLNLIILLSINVGIINILPIPAFDGGHILFLIIEKIKGSPINQKFENWCHTIFFILLMLLIIFVTIHDIIKLF